MGFVLGAWKDQFSFWVLFLGLGSLRKESGRIRTRWMFKKGEEQWDGKSRKMEKEKKMKEE